MSSDNLTSIANGSFDADALAGKLHEQTIKMIENAPKISVPARGTIDSQKLIAASERLEKLIQESSRKAAEFLQKSEEARERLLQATTEIGKALKKREREQVEMTASAMKKLQRPVTAIKTARFRKLPSA